jgi:hypothetical protein
VKLFGSKSSMGSAQSASHADSGYRKRLGRADPFLRQRGRNGRDLTGAFDDGLVIGRGLLAGDKVFVAAQEGRFLGGAFGEVHAAKLVGLLRAANNAGVKAVLLMLDTGGVRLTGPASSEWTRRDDPGMYHCTLAFDREHAEYAGPRPLRQGQRWCRDTRWRSARQSHRRS